MIDGETAHHHGTSCATAAQPAVASLVLGVDQGQLGVERRQCAAAAHARHERHGGPGARQRIFCQLHRLAIGEQAHFLLHIQRQVTLELRQPLHLDHKAATELHGTRSQVDQQISAVGHGHAAQQGLFARVVAQPHTLATDLYRCIQRQRDIQHTLHRGVANGLAQTRGRGAGSPDHTQGTAAGAQGDQAHVQAGAGQLHAHAQLLRGQAIGHHRLAGKANAAAHRAQATQLHDGILRFKSGHRNMTACAVTQPALEGRAFNGLERAVTGECQAVLAGTRGQTQRTTRQRQRRTA